MLAAGLLLLFPAVPCGLSAFDAGSNEAAAAVLVLSGSGACVALILVGAALLLFRHSVPKERAKNEAERALLEDQLAAHQAEVKRIIGLYDLAMDRWDQLYYCERDDCVFVPGDDTYAPIAQMEKYLSTPR